MCGSCCESIGAAYQRQFRTLSKPEQSLFWVLIVAAIGVNVAYITNQIIAVQNARDNPIASYRCCVAVLTSTDIGLCWWCL
jgi:hypothetical protein